MGIVKTKAERLVVAGAVAPALRASPTKHARVTVVNVEGQIVGYTTRADLQKQILARAKIELDVVEGHRPDKTVCDVCGRINVVQRIGQPRKRCEPCRKMIWTTCGRCGRGRWNRTHTKMCPDCHREVRAERTKESPVAAEQLRRSARVALPCAGIDGVCPKSAVSPSHAMTPKAIRRRDGRPWRCSLCSQRHRRRCDGNT